MNDTLFVGELVRLAALDEKADAEAFARWSRDSEFWRLMDTRLSREWSADRVREELGGLSGANFFLFTTRTLDDDRLIGHVTLEVNHWQHGEGWVGIGLGEREYWGRGYGTDAMRLILRYAFAELNLHRVSLTVFDYNPRAVRSYEKCGFLDEGRMRQCLNRDGRRWDMIFMGILREEWEKGNSRS